VTPPLLLGLDAGTSAVKAALFDADGRELAHGRAPTPWRPLPTGAEVDPGALLDAAIAAAAEALAGAPDGRVAGIGVASMAETGVLLDGAGRPVVPAIAWNDTRGAEQAERLAADLGADAFAASTGLPCSPMCTLAKYRWLRDHGEADRARRWLNVAEWIVHGLGGEPVAELSLASRTGFYDLHERRPWDEALAWAGAPAGLMPEAAGAGMPLGAAGDALPRARGAVLAVGGHDHPAAAVGAGATAVGDVLNSCGTAEAFVRVTEPLDPDRVARAVAQDMTVAWHAVAGRQSLQGAVWSGAELERLLREHGIDPDHRDELEAAVLEIERTRAGDGAAAAYHAALERFAADGAAVLARMDVLAGPAQRLVVTGGWAAGEGARAVKRRRLGAFDHVPGLWAGARGAALAAAMASGLEVS
jgi:sugar (pentulose or hexulose) kinase